MYCVLLVPWFSFDLSPPSYTYLLHMCLINDPLQKKGSMCLINNMRLITRVYGNSVCTLTCSILLICQTFSITFYTFMKCVGAFILVSLPPSPSTSVRYSLKLHVQYKQHLCIELLNANFKFLFSLWLQCSYIKGRTLIAAITMPATCFVEFLDTIHCCSQVNLL